MGNQGELWAADIDPSRLGNLRGRLKRSGAKAQVVQLEPGREEEALGGQHFDGVLVDAPCSELGTLRRHPGARWRLQPQDFDHLPALQRRLFELGQRHLRPDGRLVYATCTLRRAENQDVVGSAYQSETLTPHRTGTDGFFIAWTPGCGLTPPLK
jgi:16S rRNA (cytosine967-C5)-methyltransferase